MNESRLSDEALAELLTLTVEVDRCGNHTHRNHSGQLHRIHGPAVITPSGDECWHQDGQRHRTDGPAIALSSGTNMWYQNNLLHRTDGPAIECADGGKCWLLNGDQLTEEQFNERIKSL